MMARKQILLAAFVGYTLTLHTASAQNLDSLKLDNKMPILNNRAFFTFPSQAKASPNFYEVIPNVEYPKKQTVEQTNINVPVGEGKLSFYAKELFVFGEENLFETIASQNDK